MQLVKTLSALAVVGIAGQSLYALDIKDETLKLGLVANLQTRAEISKAKDTAGDDYDVTAGATGTPDTADFYVRRFRPGFKGTYMDTWKFAMIFRGDDYGRAATGTGAANLITIHQAYVNKEFKGDGITHTIKAGLDYAFFNQAEVSNSTSLLLNQRADAAFLGLRGVGIGYLLTTPMVHLGVDIQNNKGDDTASQNPTTGDGEGLAISGRIEITGPGELAIPKWQESFVGAEGTGFLIGLEYALNQRDRVADADPVTAGNQVGAIDTTVFGIDVLGHWNFLSALATYRMQKQGFSKDVPPGAGADAADVDGTIIGLQVGWAFPTELAVFEPAVRYQILDYNTDNDNEASTFGAKDYSSGSGNQFDIGLNVYFNGHANKLCFAYTDWKAEEGDGKASIFRIQHQLNF
jgi:hypothetical protein